MADRGQPFHRLLPAGDRAVLVEVDGTASATALALACHERPLADQVDVVGGATTVLVVFDRPVDLEAAAHQLRSRLTEQGADAEGTEHVVDVVYDGEDLHEVAELTSLSTDGVVAAHTGRPWTVAFAGFSPGFAYLSGGDPRLRVPRRPSPRTEVPPGAVALAGEFSCVYPRASPGGWQLVGRTGIAVWDLDRRPPSLLQVGDSVSFRAVREVLVVPARAAPQAQPAPASPGPALRVVAAGACSTVQDSGRTGSAGLGVSPSGPMDAGALRRANRAVGNHLRAAALEVAGGGVQLAAEGDLVVAVTGSPAVHTAAGAPPSAAGRRRQPGPAFALRDGDVLRLGAPRRQLWSYVAVRGGVDVPDVLGSRATDTLSGLGPARLADGDRLPVGRWVREAVEVVDPLAAPEEVERGGPDDEVVVEVVLGPRADWFTRAALQRLLEQEWLVTPRSDRVGLRLHGRAPLERCRHDELPSEGVVAGALQVPPDGQPVLFAADHPVTGGYPVVAVVTAADLPRAANVAPGARLRFRTATPGEDRACAPS